MVLQSEQAPASEDISNRSPHRHTHPVCRAGTPTTRAWAETSLVTTAPAPTNAYSPIVTPQTIVEFAPKDAPRRTSVRWYSDFRLTWLRGVITFVKTMDGPQKTSSSSSTPV